MERWGHSKSTFARRVWGEKIKHKNKQGKGDNAHTNVPSIKNHKWKFLPIAAITNSTPEKALSVR